MEWISTQERLPDVKNGTLMGIVVHQITPDGELTDGVVALMTHFYNWEIKDGCWGFGGNNEVLFWCPMPAIPGEADNGMD